MEIKRRPEGREPLKPTYAVSLEEFGYTPIDGRFKHAKSASSSGCCEYIGCMSRFRLRPSCSLGIEELFLSCRFE